MSEVNRYDIGGMADGGIDVQQFPDGYWVKHEDYTALKAERDALAVECTQYKSLAEKFAERADDYKSEHFGYSVFDSSNEFKQHIKTPATDAYLNSVRAEGVEMFGKTMRSRSEGFSESSSTALNYAAIIADDFAAQLRAGEPS